MAQEKNIRRNRDALMVALRTHLPDIHQTVDGNSLRDYVALSADDPTKVSYAKNPDDQMGDGRIRTTLGRYIGRRLKITITPDIERGIQAIFGECAFDLERFAVRSDVCEVYRLGPSSCMKDKEWTAWYDENGVQIVTYAYPGETRIAARALLWTLDSGAQFLDRIYPAGGVHVEHYGRWITARGIAYSYDHGPRLLGAESFTCRTYGAMPYMDTLVYLWPNGKLRSDHASDSLCVRETDGSEVIRRGKRFVFVDSWRCPHCGEACDQNDAHTVDGDLVCEFCAENASYCDFCETSTFGDSTRVNDSWLCDECLRNEATCCEHCSEYVLNDDAHEVGSEQWCNSCIGNDAYHCELCDCLSADSMHEYDEQTVCDDCLDDVIRRAARNLVSKLETIFQGETSNV